MTDKVSLEVAKRLKGMGWGQEKSEFYYIPDEDGEYVVLHSKEIYSDDCDLTEDCPAKIACPTIGELQAVVTDEDIANFLIEKIYFRGEHMPGVTGSEVLRSADLLAEVWMWKQEKEKV